MLELIEKSQEIYKYLVLLKDDIASLNITYDQLLVNLLMPEARKGIFVSGVRGKLISLVTVFSGTQEQILDLQCQRATVWNGYREGAEENVVKEFVIIDKLFSVIAELQATTLGMLETYGWYQDRNKLRELV